MTRFQLPWFGSNPIGWPVATSRSRLPLVTTTAKSHTDLSGWWLTFRIVGRHAADAALCDALGVMVRTAAADRAVGQGGSVLGNRRMLFGVWRPPVGVIDGCFVGDVGVTVGGVDG